MKSRLLSPFLPVVFSRSKQASSLTSRRQLFHHTPILFNTKRPEDWGIKKKKLFASNYVKAMAAKGDQVALELEPLRKSVKEQGKIDSQPLRVGTFIS